MPVEAVGELLAATQPLLDVDHHLLQRRIGRLLAEDVYRFHQRQAGPDEGGQLAGQVHDLFALDLRAGDLDLEQALLLGHPDVTQVRHVQ